MGGLPLRSPRRVVRPYNEETRRRTRFLGWVERIESKKTTLIMRKRKERRTRIGTIE